MFLKEFVKDCEILLFKQPYKVFKVDHRKIIRELWQTDISDSYPEDVKIKKLIANVNFGLLEKMTNTAGKSYSFDDLREALYYQHKVGGRITKIASYYDEEVETDTDEFEMQQKENDKKTLLSDGVGQNLVEERICIHKRAFASTPQSQNVSRLQ